MRLHELPCQWEAKAQGRLPSGDAGAMEACKNLLLLFGRNTGSIVHDDDRRLTFVATGLKPNMTTLVRVCDCVAQDMLYRLPEATSITDDAAGV